MSTENNKNLKYQSRNSIRPARKKLIEGTPKSTIKNIVISFVTAIKNKHF